MLQLILCHLCRSSDAYKVTQVYLFKNFKRDFLESDKSALIWYLHQALIEWCGRLRACVVASVGHFEQFL